MTKIFVFGIGGRMGKTVCAHAAEHDCEIVGGLDTVVNPDYPTVGNVYEASTMPFDVIVDFSDHTAIELVISLAKMRKCPVVLAATGYTESEQVAINDLASVVPVLKSGNMSVGMNVVTELIKRAAAALRGYDVEIVEKHHNQKLDSPSGTALQLYEAISEVKSEAKPVYGRQGAAKRTPDEIGIHSVRGGTVVGEHEVLFLGKDEIITIKHQAGSRDIFAHGALDAAKFLVGKAPRIYSIENILD